MNDATIPQGWTTYSLRDLIDRSFTGPSPTCEERQIRSDEEWGLLKTTAVTWDGWNETAHKVPPREYWGNESIEVHSGDILVTKAGPRHRVGVVVHVATTRPRIMVSGKIVGLRPKKGLILPTVLAGLLSTDYAQDYLNSRPQEWRSRRRTSLMKRYYPPRSWSRLWLSSSGSRKSWTLSNDESALLRESAQSGFEPRLASCEILPWAIGRLIASGTWLIV